MNKITYSELIQLMSDRYSCRQYASIPVDRQLIAQLLEAARIAPSACNKQPWKFIVADTPQLCKAITDCYEREWIHTAPAFIVAVGLHEQAWHRATDGKDHTDVDLSIAIEHICLAATTLGLGTCWICNFDANKLHNALQLPEEQEPIAIIPIGYPAHPSIPEKKRKTLEDITQWG